MGTRDAGRRRGPRRHPRPLCARKIHRPSLSIYLSILPTLHCFLLRPSLFNLPPVSLSPPPPLVRPSLPFSLCLSSPGAVTGSSDGSVYRSYSSPSCSLQSSLLFSSLLFSSILFYSILVPRFAILQGVHARGWMPRSIYYGETFDALAEGN